MLAVRCLAVASAATVWAGSAVATAAAQVALSVDELCRLVDQTRQVQLTYYMDPDDAEIRTVDVYGMGRTMGGHAAIFGLQQNGYSRSGFEGSSPLPGWRSFRLDRLVGMQETGETFRSYPPSREDVRNMGSWACTNDVMATAFE